MDLSLDELIKNKKLNARGIQRGVRGTRRNSFVGNGKRHGFSSGGHSRGRGIRGLNFRNNGIGRENIVPLSNRMPRRSNEFFNVNYFKPPQVKIM